MSNRVALKRFSVIYVHENIVPYQIRPVRDKFRYCLCDDIECTFHE